MSNPQAIDTNNTVIEQGEKLGVRSYIFAPCIVCESPSDPCSFQEVHVI